MKKRYLSFILTLFSIFFFACKTSKEPNIYTQEPYLSMTNKQKIEFITKNSGTRKNGEYLIEEYEIDEYGTDITSIWYSTIYNPDIYGFAYELMPEEREHLSIIITVNENSNYFKFTSELYENENQNTYICGAIGKINVRDYNHNNQDETINYEYVDTTDNYFKTKTNIYINVLIENISDMLIKYNLKISDFGFLNC